MFNWFKKKELAKIKELEEKLQIEQNNIKYWVEKYYEISEDFHNSEDEKYTIEAEFKELQEEMIYWKDEYRRMAEENMMLEQDNANLRNEMINREYN